MYNDKKRKVTSLMLMIVMVAGGLTFAAPGMEPAFAADDELTVSAQEIGNFAGIQVIEIVVDDDDIDDTEEGTGKPDVTIGGKDIHMIQATDGSWYAYVVNNQGISDYADFNDIYQSDIGDESDIGGNTDAVAVYTNATKFLDGAKTINESNNESGAINNWPFIQSLDLGTGDVEFSYGSEDIELSFEYDDDKDITLDRDHYPTGSYIHITTDDSLLNLSPVANESWVFFTNGTVAYVYEDETYTPVDYALVGFDKQDPISVSNSDDVFSFTNSTILDVFGEAGDDNDGEAIILKTSNTDDNLFVNYGNNDASGLIVKQDGQASIEYNDNHSVVYRTFTGTLVFVETAIVEWLSGVEIDLILTDEDRNLNSLVDEDLEILGGEVPFVKIGSPITIDLVDDVHWMNGTTLVNGDDVDTSSVTSSKVAAIVGDTSGETDVIHVTVDEHPYDSAAKDGYVFTYINYDMTAIGGSSGTFFAGYNGTDADLPDGVYDVSDNSDNSSTGAISFIFNSTGTDFTEENIYFDVLFFGQLDDIATDGEINENVDRVNDAIYRFELEETDENTAKFKGSIEYIMINQLNVFDQETYDSIRPADDSVIIIVNDDMDGKDAVTISYEDLNSSKSEKTISVNEDANTHTGMIELDSTNYSSGNTIEVTLIDVDLNTDSDTIQTYDVDTSNEWVGNDKVWLSQLKINDVLFADTCGQDLGLYDTGFTLSETGDATGIFVGTFQLPVEHCVDGINSVTTNGLDLKFEYQDYSDASGVPNETSNKASIRSNTGSVSLDSSVYPVPFSTENNAFYTYDSEISELGDGPVVISIRVNDSDFNLAANGEDTMSTDYLTIVVARGGDDKQLWPLSSGTDAPPNQLNELTDAELVETNPESGIFEIEVDIADQDYGFDEEDNGFSIQQGDILTVTYTDPNDASGDSNTVTDSATFDLRNGVLQTDKKEYIIGSDTILTLIEPDLNLDSGKAETWSLDLINWDSDAGDLNLGDAIFDANPAGLRETGDNTGIFQTVFEIPEKIGTDSLERGESITLEYQDNGPAGANYIGDDDEDISVDIATSNFGASVSLDQKIYTWTDKVYVTIVSPDHNFDSSSIDEIGGDSDNEINVSTRENELDQYKLVETGPDTGIFVGELALTGFAHDADGDGDLTDTRSETNGSGPTSGLLEASEDDGLTVSFEASDGKTVLGSALIRWNIGEVQWLEASYPASGSGVIRVIDPDMNWNPESVDSFDITVWSDSSTGGINLSVTETNEATGIFEGTVFFTTTQGSSGSRLNVSEGDQVIAEYEDRTLPDPYSKADDLGITAVANIGTIVPPLERAPAGHLRAVDAFGNSISVVSIDQQVQVEADISNNQDRDQTFAYLVQIQDKNGVTVSLAWITGTLTPGQNFSPALSWIPESSGEYTVTAFVWESVNNPTALSPPITTTISVS